MRVIVIAIIACTVFSCVSAVVKAKNSSQVALLLPTGPMPTVN
jgi:hypothetical protein